MKMFKRFLLILAIPALVACSVTPKTPAQALLSADASFTALTEELIVMRQTGIIEDGSQTEAKAQTMVRDVNASLEAAHAALGAGEMETFQDYLRAINSGLLQLQQILTERSEQ